MLGFGKVKGLLAPTASKSPASAGQISRRPADKAASPAQSRSGAPSVQPTTRLTQPTTPKLTAPAKPAASAKPTASAGGDLYAVPAEVVRPGKQGYHLSLLDLKLPTALLNTIYEAAYTATAAVPGEIVSVSLHIAAPGTQPVLQVLRAPGSQNAAPQTTQPAALQQVLISTEDDDADDDADHECEFRSGFCWMCGQPDPDAFDDNSVNVIDWINDALASLRLHNQPQRFELAVEIAERAEQAGIDLDDLEAVWDWWQDGLGYVYTRIVNTSHNPRNVPDTLFMAEQILELGRKRGQNTPARAWEYFTLYGKVITTLQGEKRRPQVVLEDKGSHSAERSRGGRHDKRGKR